MAISKAMESAMEDAEFTASLDAMQTKEEVVAAFAAKGIDVEQEMGLSRTEGELSEEDLDNVSGGIGLATLALAVSLGWKVGADAGVLLRAYYDMKRYGNPYYSYSKARVNGILKKLGLE